MFSWSVVGRQRTRDTVKERLKEIFPDLDVERTVSLMASGNLWRDALVMYDRQTKSLWQMLKTSRVC